MTPLGVVLDFDGVVLDSVGIKTEAFSRLFAPEGAEARRRVVEYHLANGGISRLLKFRWAYREVLRRPLDPDEERRLGERFNELVEEAVQAAPWIPGSREFLEAAHARIPLFVASGTPEEELRRIVGRRGMSRYFRGVFGSPAAKSEILAGVAASLGAPTNALLMVGDALNDHDGAAAAGAAFVGFVRPGEACPFPPGVATCGDLRELASRLGL